jgi:regulator of MON1-CCZ1 complex
MSKVVNLRIVWYMYHPPTRLLVVSTGPVNLGLYRVRDATNIVKLSTFRWNPPMPRNNAPVSPFTLNRKHIVIVGVYNEEYVGVWDDRPFAGILYLYLVTPNGCLHRASCSIGYLGIHNTLAIHIVDNLLVIHNLDSKISLFFDIAAKSIGKLLQPLARWPISLFADSEHESLDDPQALAFGWQSTNWTCTLPYYLTSVVTGTVYRLRLDVAALLQEIVNSRMHDSVSILEFLDRRNNPLDVDLKYSYMQNCLRWRTSLSNVRRMFDVYCRQIQDRLIPYLPESIDYGY